MKNKVLLLALILLIIASVSSFAIGIGGAFAFEPTGGNSAYYGGAVSFKFDSLPLIALSYAPISNGFAVGGTADWWLWNNNLLGPINGFVGVGGYGSVRIGDFSGFGAGIRFPLGLNWFIINPVEIFLEFAPAFGFDTSNPNYIGWGGLQSAIGFRFWF